MKRFICSFLALALICLAVSAMAGDINRNYVQQIFSNYTGLNGTARYSIAYKVDRDSKKTIVYNQYSTTTVTAPTTVGTQILQCGVTSTGPWITAKDRGANAISSTTTTAIYDLASNCNWYRVGWTRSVASPTRSISAWILFGD